MSTFTCTQCHQEKREAHSVASGRPTVCSACRHVEAQEKRNAFIAEMTTGTPDQQLRKMAAVLYDHINSPHAKPPTVYG